ncbi:hypothetical protein MBANPS3_009728 [Mucor bainieri]
MHSVFTYQQINKFDQPFRPPGREATKQPLRRRVQREERSKTMHWVSEDGDEIAFVEMETPAPSNVLHVQDRIARTLNTAGITLRSMGSGEAVEALTIMGDWLNAEENNSAVDLLLPLRKLSKKQSRDSKRYKSASEVIEMEAKAKEKKQAKLIAKEAMALKKKKAASKKTQFKMCTELPIRVLPGSTKPSKLPIQVMRNLKPFMKDHIVPGSVLNVKGDGNCGFRAVRAALGYDEESYQIVRRCLRNLLHASPDHYLETACYGKQRCFDDLAITLSWEGESCEPEYYMKMPETGYLLAEFY